MSLWKNYLVPASIQEALAALEGSQGSAAVIAGGTDLLLDLDQGRRPPVDTLVDITSIEDLQQLSIDSDEIFIGAAVTHSQIVTSPELQQHAQCLVEGCGLIGGPQVRNVATIGGNVAHGLPAGDATIALVALDAQACLVNSGGERWQPIGELFEGPGKTTFEHNHELLKGFRIPTTGPNEHSVFERIMRPQGVAIAILNMALYVHFARDKTVESTRIAVGPGGPTPFRARAAEERLRGRPIDRSHLEQIVETLLGEIKLRTSPYRATREYRRHLVAALLERSFDRIQRSSV